MDTSGESPADRRERAYTAGAYLAKDRIERDSPDDAAALAALEAEDVVVVRGGYDRVESVLTALDLPFTAIDPEQLGRARLRPEQLLVVNCPGHLDPAGLRVVERFVSGGGSLFTTDWALRNVIESAFPGTIAYNEQPTADDVVRVEIRERGNRFLEGVIDPGQEPVWWLEGSSYPVRVLDAERVTVLIGSAEMAARYGEGAICVLFPWGEGEVLHMASHYYLQRSELRGARAASPASALADEMGIDGAASVRAGLRDLDLAEVESTYSSSRWLANVIADKKRRADAGEGGER